MKWRTILTAVDLDTGEQIKGIALEIKKRYKIVKKYKKPIYINTEYGEIYITWECIKEPEQLKLEL